VNDALASVPAAASGSDAAAESATEWRNTLRRDLVFASRAWAGVVTACYGFEDCTVRSGAAWLPLFASWSPLFGRKLVSAVYNFYASPVYDSAAECTELLALARAAAEAHHARVVEIKSLIELPAESVARAGLVPLQRYKLTLLPLADHATLWARYSPNFRSHLRKARNRAARAGVRLYRSNEAADMAAFHDLLMRRYRNKHYMIGQPGKLFALIRRHFLLPGNGDLWLARTGDGVLVGGMVLLTHGRTVTACFGASHDAYQHLSVDALLKDATIAHYAAQGFRVYDLGITSPKQVDLLFAKSRFGGLTFDLPYYVLPLAGSPAADVDFSDAYMWLRRPFRYVPVPVAKLLSSALVRYLN